MNDKIKNLIIVSTFICLAFSSFLYVQTLPEIMPQDEYTILLANQAAVETNYPEREMLLNYDYSTYIYHQLVEFLDENFIIENYRAFLLFMYVFLTGYICYLSLRLINISRLPALVTAIIALFPRLSLGSTFFGVFTNKENMGRSLAFPFIWILSCWHIHRIQENKENWPVFFFIGLVSYIHPVSMLFFAGLLLLVTIIYYSLEHKWKYGFRQFILSLFAFVVGAAPLLWEVFTRTKGIATGFVTANEYVTALDFRLGWEFPPDNLIWLKAIILICVVFIVFIFLAWQKLKRESLETTQSIYHILCWSILVSIISVFLSIFLPALQLFLIRYFNTPLLVQQTSRFFIFFYLGLFIAFAVMLDYMWNHVWIQNKWKNIALGSVLVIGIISSNIGSEWLQFLTGYGSYDRYYIPAAFQSEQFEESDLVVYSKICQTLNEFGAGNNSKIITDDGLRLLYFCKIPLYTTWQEGGAYLNAGKKAFVDWYDRYMDQSNTIDSNNPQTFLTFAKKVGATHVVLRYDSGIVSKLINLDLPMKTVEGRIIIDLDRKK